MNLPTRLSVVAALGLFGFAAAFALTHWAFRGNTRGLLDEQVAQKRHQFDVALKLQSLGPETAVASYAWRDDTAAFVEKPDPKWATENVNNLVGTPEGGDALWVLTPDLRPVHAIDANFRRLRLPVENRDELRRHIGEHRSFHFYAVEGNQLWQIFGAAVQSSRHQRSDAPVHGYLLLGRRCDDAWLKRLGSLCGAHLTLQVPAPDPAAERPPGDYGFGRTFRHEIAGLGGKPVALLFGRVDLGDSAEFTDAGHGQLFYLEAWTLALLAALAGAIVYFVIVPVGRIARTVQTQDPLPVAEMLTEPHEFGVISRQLVGSIRRDRKVQETLRREVEQAQSPLGVESGEAIKLRIAGRLQGGPVTALVTAGQRLEAIELDYAAKRRVDVERIHEARQSIDRATAELRTILLDLEPADLRNQDFAAALRRLEQRMRPAVGSQFHLEVEDRVAQGISREAQVLLFNICSELTENALKHAQPDRASLTLNVRANRLLLVWANNGVNSREFKGPGKGLREIQNRAQELGGTCRVDATSDEWRVDLEVPYTSLLANAE